ncbi:MAG: ankyrin repeat domain-containing protein, partial [Bdellovibrionota bacterium]
RDSLQLDLGEVAGAPLPSPLQSSLHIHDYVYSDPDRSPDERIEDSTVTCAINESLTFKNSCDGIVQEDATAELLRGAAAGDVESVERAVACGADVNAINSVGCTPAMLAIETDQRDCTSPQPVIDSLRHYKGGYIFGFLTDNGAYLYPAEKRFGQTIAHKLVLNYEADLLKTLVLLEEDINVQDAAGNTPLMLAADKGYEKLVPILVEGGADLTLKDKSGLTAFDRGARLNADVRDMLLPAKAEVVVEGSASGTCAPLKVEAKRGEYTKLTLKATGQMFMLSLPAAKVSLMTSAGSSASKTFKLDKVGIYPFECGVHGGRQYKGQLKVK